MVVYDNWSGHLVRQKPCVKLVHYIHVYVCACICNMVIHVPGTCIHICGV